jgi:hypothetical protein
MKDTPTNPIVSVKTSLNVEFNPERVGANWGNASKNSRWKSRYEIDIPSSLHLPPPPLLIQAPKWSKSQLTEFVNDTEDYWQHFSFSDDLSLSISGLPMGYEQIILFIKILKDKKSHAFGLISDIHNNHCYSQISEIITLQCLSAVSETYEKTAISKPEVIPQTNRTAYLENLKRKILKISEDIKKEIRSKFGDNLETSQKTKDFIFKLNSELK